MKGSKPLSSRLNVFLTAVAKKSKVYKTYLQNMQMKGSFLKKKKKDFWFK